MSGPVLYVTGTNTGVGKTVLSTLLLERARERKLTVGAMKPFCTGERDDAQKLHIRQTAGLTLNEVNPFFFADPVTPLIAAKNAGKPVRLDETLVAIRKLLVHPLLIEGAGGLLSPLGESFSFLEIVREIPGMACVVGPNVLGVINSVLLTLRAIDNRPAVVVLMNQKLPDASSGTNAEVIEKFSGKAVINIPFLESITTKGLEIQLDSLVDQWLSVRA